jgi:hypothetical protein
LSGCKLRITEGNMVNPQHRYPGRQIGLLHSSRYHAAVRTLQLLHPARTIGSQSEPAPTPSLMPLRPLPRVITKGRSNVVKYLWEKGMAIYTDTNGEYPKNLSSALRLLEIAMDLVTLDQIDFLRFNEVAREIDKIESSRANDDI